LIITNYPKLKETTIKAEDIPLDIYYEDSDLIVVNKPSGMVVHPASGNFEGTLVNALIHHCKDLSGINSVNDSSSHHPINT
jgi:23S rRNA pseudouridine1911/1915/1917 synthase